jgi:predicted  nucleic acid-binding Zn-ribbon protein
LTSKATEKKDVRLDDGLPSQNIREQTANEATKVKDGMEDSKYGIVEVKHEIAKIEHEVDEVQHEAVKDEHETEQTKQTEPEVDQLQHEAEQAEHETEQTGHDVDETQHEAWQAEHETEQTEHDVDQTQHESEHAEHENELKEHEVIKNLDEKEKIVHKDVDDEEMDIFKNERSCCKGEEIATENMLNKTEGKEINELSCNEDSNKDVLNSLNRSTIITDTLEKGMDSINIKESSPEIQVRVT